MAHMDLKYYTLWRYLRNKNTNADFTINYDYAVQDINGYLIFSQRYRDDWYNLYLCNNIIIRKYKESKPAAFEFN